MIIRLTRRQWVVFAICAALQLMGWGLTWHRTGRLVSGGVELLVTHPFGWLAFIVVVGCVSLVNAVILVELLQIVYEPWQKR